MDLFTGVVLREFQNRKRRTRNNIFTPQAKRVILGGVREAVSLGSCYASLFNEKYDYNNHAGGETPRIVMLRVAARVPKRVNADCESLRIDCFY